MDQEEKNYVKVNSNRYCGPRIMSPEIVEIGEDSKSISTSRDGGVNDVYVAVGKDDLDVLKWALDHAVSPGARVFLVHVFPPFTYIRTSVGRLSRSQLSSDQLRFYINEENNKRKSKLQKYIRLCNEAKVKVDTMLIESSVPAKSILELITVLNITYLVMGVKHAPRPRSRLLRERVAKGEYVRNNAPDYCEVTIVCEGQKVTGSQQETALMQHSSLSSSHQGPDNSYNSEKKLLCFSGLKSKICNIFTAIRQDNAKRD